jgi:2-oxoglutarate dehydrogenase E2 component (dihydrolipoamide succinyltransferase)
MIIELKVPVMGESITEVEIGNWLKTPGASVARDEAVVLIESEKASVELPSPEAGTLTKILVKQGETAKVGQTIAQLETGAAAADSGAAPATATDKTADAASPTPAATPAKADKKPTSVDSTVTEKKPAAAAPAVKATPVAQRIMQEHHLHAEQIEPTGPGGRVSKADVLRHLEQSEQERQAPPADQPSPSPADSSPTEPPAQKPAAGRQEQAVRMSMLRRTVAKRLVEAQHSAALLTTFNEVDMTAILALRKEHQEGFVKKYGVKLGFMSFFAKAVVDALKQFPQLNAQIRGQDIVYHNYHDLGLAVSTDRGLVVPVLTDADRLSFAEIERAILDFATRARQGTLKPQELTGGTFTITNGGVFGSLLSTPLVNPPQSGILGMHTIQERPIALAGQVVIRPMMYIALTYDHRIVDGKEAVLFLRRIKEAVENPTRMLLEI